MVDWLRAQLPNKELPRLRNRLIDWCEINSGTENAAGLARMHDKLMAEFAPLADQSESITLPPCQKYDELGQPFELPLGNALRFTCRPDAAVQVLLNGHMDTVYGRNSAFQKCDLLDERTLRGPGVSDMKGGLLVMLEALRLFESIPGTKQLGWEVIINPDEEIGTPGARELLKSAAENNHFGLVFESSTIDGQLVRRRLGTGFFMAEVRGRSAHAGRNFDQGRNAIEALSALVLELRGIHQKMDGAVILNTARFHSAAMLNTVPDFASAQFNFRATGNEAIDQLETQIAEKIAAVEREYEVGIEWTGEFYRPPRVPDRAVTAMERSLESCLSDLGQQWSWRDTGGGTDGSLLLGFGLPNLDSVGVRGNFLHSDREQVFLPSLIERAHLNALFLVRAASGEIDVAAFSSSSQS